MRRTNAAVRVVGAVALMASMAVVGYSQEAPARAPAARAGGPRAPQVTSPEVLPDGKVVFRIVAAEAESVGLSAGDIPGISGDAAPKFTKGDNGVWEATIGPVDPGAYRYRFNVDGVQVVDPRNPAISESNTNVSSLVYVPGTKWMDTLQAPHGAVSEVHYYSKSLERWRRMHVYTPPGYEARGSERYPLFYLLHGAGDNDDAWTSVGRAGFILDNLIAGGEAKPMVVVMTAGHTSAAGFGAAPRGASEGPPRDEFYEDFVNDVMPYIEKNYRVRTDRANTAIAGLSMGGMQTLNVAFHHLDRFAYVGVYSSAAVFGDGDSSAWEEAHAANLGDAGLKKGLRLLWLATGVDDFLIERSRQTVEMFKKHGFDPQFKETAGGHTWINW
ncbi:MAG: esterase, partial [Thermoleophilia bacterium]|nr:esterase [Thermoleophilia bacterium]